MFYLYDISYTFNYNILSIPISSINLRTCLLDISSYPKDWCWYCGTLCFIMASSVFLHAVRRYLTVS